MKGNPGACRRGGPGRGLVRLIIELAVVAVAGVSAIARAAPVYDIATLGFTDAEHTRDDGYRYSEPRQLTEAGLVSGVSTRWNGGAAPLGETAWLYNGSTLLNIGFTDPEHTRDDGYRYSDPRVLTESGLVSGISTRWNEGAAPLGVTAWLYDGSTTVNIGLADAEHTRDDGYRYSEPRQLNGSGLVGGVSFRFSGHTNLGQTAWLYDGAATLNISLTDAEHTRDDGYRYSRPWVLTDSGLIGGVSDRFSGHTNLGRTAWLYDGAATLNIGLTDAEHTRDDGHRYSEVQRLTESGLASGIANRFSGHTNLGRTAWLYDGAATLNIGLTDAEHTRDDGYRYSEPRGLTEAGLVSGIASRFSGHTNLGLTAWFYNGSTTVNIGLTDAEHTRDDGYRNSNPRQLTGSGLVSGMSARYNGSAYLGLTAWLYDGATTLNVGLTDAEHTRADGYRRSVPEQLTETGLLCGWSDRYNGAASFGRTAWLYDGATTLDIGLTDAEHTRDDGYRYSEPRGLTESGFVSGESQRYNGGPTALGTTAWVYDPVSHTTVPLVGSVRSDGYAFSRVLYLGEGGLALGYYNWYAPDDSFLGTRAFSWTHAYGFSSLDLLVSGGLPANGWAQLDQAQWGNAAEQIMGVGERLDQTGGQAGYLLTAHPAQVPEPGTLGLAVVGLMALVRRSRRGRAPGAPRRTAAGRATQAARSPGLRPAGSSPRSPRWVLRGGCPGAPRP